MKLPCRNSATRNSGTVGPRTASIFNFILLHISNKRKQQLQNEARNVIGVNFGVCVQIAVQAPAACRARRIADVDNSPQRPKTRVPKIGWPRVTQPAAAVQKILKCTFIPFSSNLKPAVEIFHCFIV